MDGVNAMAGLELTNFSQLSRAAFSLRRLSCKSILWSLGDVVKRRMGQADRAIDPSPISHCLVKERAGILRSSEELPDLNHKAHAYSTGPRWNEVPM